MTGILGALLASYQLLVVVGLLVGFGAAAWFSVTHRPRQWRRLIAWDASGWVWILGALYLRSLVVTAMRWPVPPPKSWDDAIVGLLFLFGIDAVLVIRVVLFNRFRRQHGHEPGETAPSRGATPAEISALLDRITVLETELMRRDVELARREQPDADG